MHSGNGQVGMPVDFKKCERVDRAHGLIDKHAQEAWCIPDGIKMRIERLFEELFSDQDGVIPEWIWQRWSRSRISGLEPITDSTLQELVFEMASGSSCSSDSIVMETLYHLEDDILGEVAESYRFRLINHLSEDG